MWVKKPASKVKVKLCEMGPAVVHNLTCWVCDKEPAVYDMNPNWVFRPCWDCQKNIGVFNKEHKNYFWASAKNLLTTLKEKV